MWPRWHRSSMHSKTRWRKSIVIHCCPSKAAPNASTAFCRVAFRITSIRSALGRSRKPLELQRLSAALKLPEPDKTDLHSLSRQQERRTWLRSLSDGECSKYLMTDDDRKRLPKAEADKLPKVDALTLQAILSEPPALSGANEQLWQRLYDAELDKHHAGRSAAIAAESEALANVEAALQVAAQIMHSLADASPAPKVA